MLQDELEAALVAGVAGTPLDFEAWAHRIFAHQFAQNAPYRRYCDARGVTPENVTAWTDVPPVPTAAFRHADLVCGEPEAVFQTSGTTGGADAHGRHFMPWLSLYRTAALTTFEHYTLPDGARPHVVCLLPPPTARPDSSLIHMCAWVAEAFGTSEFWGAGADGLDVDRLRSVLTEHQQHGRTVLLLGPTAGFERLFETDARFRLGPGSRVMDTGGKKGMRRPLSRAGFLRACWERLGVATYYCVNEYGMTELCSQRYDSVLRDRFDGRSLDARRLLGPPWLRTRVLDPDSLAELPAGETGLLCHHDLANAGSVSVVLTEDLGRSDGADGIEIVGRVAGAMPRGCGQLLEALAP